MSDRPPQALPDLPGLRKGLYRHYKGGTYRVLGVVRHSETLEPMVLYKPDPPYQARVRLVLPVGDGKFLLEFFDNPRYPQSLGKCRFPGGGVKAGESLRAALNREAWEEFQVDLASAWMVFLGTPGGAEDGEFYFMVPDHGIKPGSYTDADGGDTVTLVVGDTYTDGYIGPDLRTLRLPDPGQVGDAWVRPYYMWHDTFEHDGREVSRFEWVRD